MENIERMNNLIEEKNDEVKVKEAESREIDIDLLKVREQVSSFDQELNHLKQIEEKLVMENSDI